MREKIKKKGKKNSLLLVAPLEFSPRSLNEARLEVYCVAVLIPDSLCQPPQLDVREEFAVRRDIAAWDVSPDGGLGGVALNDGLVSSNYWVFGGGRGNHAGILGGRS